MSCQLAAEKVSAGRTPCQRAAGCGAPAQRAHASHKGSHGDVAVVGGESQREDSGMSGAALLAAAVLFAGTARAATVTGVVSDTTGGVLGGATKSYDFRMDLRAVYQYLCRNHPLPSEPQYPLNIGLPLDSTLKQHELAKRVDDCLGLNKPAAERTPEQAAATS